MFGFEKTTHAYQMCEIEPMKTVLNPDYYLTPKFYIANCTVYEYIWPKQTPIFVLHIAGSGPAVALITSMSEATQTVPLLKPEEKLWLGRSQLLHNRNGFGPENVGLIFPMK